ncbi:hypothetical protein Plhal710r2_c035g0128511 [Plasmopara halstedii]
MFDTPRFQHRATPRDDCHQLPCQRLGSFTLINRVLSATDPDESTTFAHKWAKHLGDKVPKKREELFQRVAQWWRASADSTKELVRASRALALFELMLMCTAPRIYEKDYWLQHVTGMSIAWIPAHNRRLLHPNLLLALLRSKLGEICFKLWEDVQWQGSLLDDLEALRASVVSTQTMQVCSSCRR